MKISKFIFSLLFLSLLIPATNSVQAGTWIADILPGAEIYSEDSAVGTLSASETACEALDGRVPTRIEMNLIYDNKASLGTFDETTYVDYWTANIFDANNSYQVDITDGSNAYAANSTTSSIRCVKTSTTHVASSMTAVGSEIENMFLGYLPAILVIFATLFAITLLRRLIKTWLKR